MQEISFNSVWFEFCAIDHIEKWSTLFNSISLKPLLKIKKVITRSVLFDQRNSSNFAAKYQSDNKEAVTCYYTSLLIITHYLQI